MRPGRRLGVDVGRVRIGVAASDPGGVLATPVETVRRGHGDLARLAALAAEREVVEVVVGFPRTLRGQEGLAADEVRAFATELAGFVEPCPVRLVDERMTTSVATRHMRAQGTSSRRGRKSIDQAAAMIILQDALDMERTNGVPPGEVVTGA
ncbi:Holliday junction resolvase RuvX [Phytoactinopolyspora mesophila]|uniref:Putative pre-16S rRNA nuclease n=1 Tax=Phytoactinopolyspora mesophila TaxID=2650750 RepID=A0A7K3LYC4_9ACTN|nr:Holliday junction resolvase RuvX [Phytoactinopolyspora mesophila]NDL56025.1 Holliday junction resolvase RuvX [Phytoactinopolyspora mesophila]